MADEREQRSWFQALGHAWQGVIGAVKQERNVKIHLAAAVAVCLLGWHLTLSPWEWAVLSLAVFFVLMAELFNTAIEATVDLVTKGQYHPLAKIAKDVGAGSVLLAAINAVIIGCIIFGSRILG